MFRGRYQDAGNNNKLTCIPPVPGLAKINFTFAIDVAMAEGLGQVVCAMLDADALYLTH